MNASLPAEAMELCLVVVHNTPQYLDETAVLIYLWYILFLVGKSMSKSNCGPINLRQLESLFAPCDNVICFIGDSTADCL